MSPALSLPSPISSPISSPLMVSHHRHPATSPSSVFSEIEELDFDKVDLKLETDQEIDLELGLGLGLDLQIPAGCDAKKRKPTLPPPLMPIKLESFDAEYISAKDEKVVKLGMIKKERDSPCDASPNKSKKKRPIQFKKEEDPKKAIAKEKLIKEEKMKEEKALQEEREREEREREEREEEREDDDRGDLEPSLKRAKRFCMDSKVQKHFQLTLWYDEEKILFKVFPPLISLSLLLF